MHAAQRPLLVREQLLRQHRHPHDQALHAAVAEPGELGAVVGVGAIAGAADQARPTGTQPHQHPGGGHEGMDEEDEARGDRDAGAQPAAFCARRPDTML